MCPEMFGEGLSAQECRAGSESLQFLLSTRPSSTKTTLKLKKNHQPKQKFELSEESQQGWRHQVSQEALGEQGRVKISWD